MAAPARYHHGDLRAALTERATDVVAARGVDALSLRELARDLGVSHAAPSRHFADKQTLLDAVAVNGFRRLGASVGTSPGTDGRSTSFPDQLREYARAYVSFAVQNAPLLTVMFDAKHRQEPPADILDAAEQAFAVPLRLIGQAQSRGEIVTAPMEVVGTAIHSTMHGFATLVSGGLLDQPNWERALDETMGLLVEGLRPRGEACAG